MQDLKVVTVSLTSEVNRWVKEEYGPEYRVNSHGEVYIKKDDQPYEKYCGQWYIHANAVVILVDPVKTK